MKSLAVFAAILVAGLFFSALSGCQSTSQPGASMTMGAYATNVDATPDKVTNAASKACEDLKLTDIKSAGTKVDGHVTAMTAQGDQVKIEIAQAGDNVSRITIRVGTTGDESVSRQLVDRINGHLSWL